MPIVDIEAPDTRLPVDTPKGFAVTPGALDVALGSDAPERPSWSSVFGAQFRLENMVGSWAAAQRRTGGVADDFDPWQAIVGTPDEADWERFVDVRNAEDLAAVKRQLEREREDRKTVEAAPWWMSVPAGMVAGVVDLPTLIPGGAFVRGAHLGFSVSRSALNVGLAAGGAMAVQEAGLQSTQELRTAGESAFNIGAGVLLGGLLGAGGAALLTRGEWRSAVQAVEREMAGKRPQLPLTGERIEVADDMGATVYRVFAEGRGEPERIADAPAVVRGFMDTRGGGRRFHGSPSEIASLDDTHYGSSVNYYGQGLYTTDAVDAGWGYATRGMSKTPTLYEIAPKPDARVYDMESPISAEIRAELETMRNDRFGQSGEAVDAALNENPKNLREFYDEVRSYAAGERIPADEIQEGVFQPIADLLTKGGFDAMSHRGGLRTKAPEHSVIIFFEPSKSLTMRKLSAEEIAGLRPRPPEGRAPAEIASARIRVDGPDVAHVSAIEVAPEFQRHGVATRLYDRIEADLAKQGKRLKPDDALSGPALEFWRSRRPDLIAGHEGRESGMFIAAGIPASVGAAAVGGADLASMTIAGTAAGVVARGTARLNPALRLIHSPNPVTRETAINLFEMTQYMRGADDGIAAPQAVETLRKEWNAGLMNAVAETNTAYSAHRKAGGKLSRFEFRQEVGRAMRRADASDIPEVQAVAQAWRRDVFDPLKEAAIAAKLLPEDVGVETAASYFSRMWNRPRLIAEEAQAKQVFADWIHQSAPRWAADFEAEAAEKLAKARAKAEEARVGKAPTETEAKSLAAERALADLETEIRIEREARFGDEATTRARADDIASEVWDKLVGRAGDGMRPEFLTIDARGPLKGRTFKIPDELVERWLEDDIDLVGRRYQRIMSADVELARKFGSPAMVEQIAKVKEGYNQLRVGVTDEKQLARFSKAEKADLRDLEGVRDLLRGTYRQAQWADWGSIVRVVNAFNYLRLMGQVTISSLPEAPRAAMVHGLRPFMEAGFQGFRNPAAYKLSIAEAKLAGNINDRILSHRLATLAEITDPYTTRGPVERFMDNMTNAASNWNGIKLWTDSVKMHASVIAQNRILRASAGFEKATQQDRRYLAFLGIDQSMAGRIAQQFDEFGELIDGVHVAGTARWTDEVVKRAYRAALNKDLDSLVVTRSVADVPLLANTPLGRLIFQFNTFNLASHQRILLRGLQEGHARFLGGVVALSSIGMLGTYLAAAAGNRLDKLPSFSENPGWWIAEGLDRSGIFMVPMQIANAVEKLAGVNPVKAPIRAADVGRQQSERVRARADASFLLGPSAGLGQDLVSTVGIAKTIAGGEDVRPGQVRAAERLLPFQSYLGIRQMLRYVVNPPAE